MPRELLDLKVERGADGIVRVSIKSGYDWAYCRRPGGGDITIGFKKFYNFRNDLVVDGVAVQFNMQNLNLFSGSGAAALVNGIFLQSKDIRTGAVFDVPIGVPMSRDMLKKFHDNLQEAAKYIFKNFMRRASFHCKIITTEEEDV